MPLKSWQTLQRQSNPTTCQKPDTDLIISDIRLKIKKGIGDSMKESYTDEKNFTIDADFCLIMKGNSMNNARIMDGDIVFIRRQPEVENGEIAAVAIDDEATLKRFYRDEETGTITLVAENQACAPMVFTAENQKNVYILGKAIAFQSDVR